MLIKKLENGITLIYKHKEGSLTSLCLGFNAGALEERDFPLGTAHATEHMVYKGTKKRSEKDINILFDELFSFNNAMTNYPYAIYYGTLSSETFERGIELFSDILINPTFPETGFKNEISVIKEELSDWKEDSEQHCEDMLFYNCFDNRRIKELIIGNEESLSQITLNKIKGFYETYYCPQNLILTVVGSIKYEDTLRQVHKYFGNWNRNFKGIQEELYEMNRPGVFYSTKNKSEAVKIQYCFSLHNCTHDEIISLEIFNYIFGDGLSSVLYSAVRTENGLAYEINSQVKLERGIKQFIISLSTSKEKIKSALSVINNCILEAKESSYGDDIISKVYHRHMLKDAFVTERSVELCKKLTTNRLMFGDLDALYNRPQPRKVMKGTELQILLNKVMVNPSIGVLEG